MTHSFFAAMRNLLISNVPLRSRCLTHRATIRVVLPLTRTPLRLLSSRGVFNQKRGLANSGKPAAARLDLTEDFQDIAYDPRRNAAYWKTRPVLVTKRTLQIGLAFGRWFAELAWEKRHASLSGQQAERLRRLLSQLGPAFVKIGQAISSRPDVISPEYLRELEKLQDKIPPFPDEDALRLLELELGVPASSIFSYLSPTSVAAASLGQVYRGILRSNGKEVALKVQRPGVRDSIALDVYILRILAEGVRRWRKLNSDLPSLLDEWAASLFKELDYRQEAANGRRFKELYGDMEGVFVPGMYEELTTQRVLVMEWVEGIKLRSGSEQLESAGTLGSQDDLRLVEIGVRCSLEQMLEQGFYHSDPHPGNLFRMADGRLAYIDFGMMGQIDASIRRGLIRATLHLVNREFEMLADDFITLGLLPSGSDKTEIVPALTRVFEKALSAGVSNLSFSELSGDLGQTMYEYKFRIPPYYTLMVRSLSVLEGVALSSNPNYKVLGSAYPWIARRLLTDSSPELKETLRALLYKDNKFQFSRLESLLQQAIKSPSRAEYVGRQDAGAAARAATAAGTGLGTAARPGTTAGTGMGTAARPGTVAGMGLGTAARPGMGLGTRTAVNGAAAAAPSGQQAAVASSRAGNALSLLLGSEASFVRDILVEELAKGIDAAWRLAWDDSLASSRRNLLDVLGVPGQEREVAEGRYSSRPGAPLVEALMQLPYLAGEDDREQFGGIMRLSILLQDQAAASMSVPAGDSLAQASAALTWLLQEVPRLPQSARIEAMRIPILIAQKVTSRVAARALRVLLSPTAPAQNPPLRTSSGLATTVRTTSETATTPGVSMTPSPSTSFAQASIAPRAVAASRGTTATTPVSTSLPLPAAPSARQVATPGAASYAQTLADSRTGGAAAGTSRAAGQAAASTSISSSGAVPQGYGTAELERQRRLGMDVGGANRNGAAGLARDANGRSLPPRMMELKATPTSVQYRGGRSEGGGGSENGAGRRGSPSGSSTAVEVVEAQVVLPPDNAAAIKTEKSALAAAMTSRSSEGGGGR